MLATLIGVIVGGLLTILSQLTVDFFRARSEKRAARESTIDLARIRQWHFYTTQHLLRDSIESERWWSGDESALRLPNDEELRKLTGLLSYEGWAMYTACVRRLMICANLRRRAGEDATLISHEDLLCLLGAYIVLDEARRSLEAITKTRSSDMRISCDRFSPDDIEICLRDHITRHVSADKWRAILVGDPKNLET